MVIVTMVTAPQGIPVPLPRAQGSLGGLSRLANCNSCGGIMVIMVMGQQ